MHIEWNMDINSAPEGERVFLLLAKGEKGNGEIAVGMVFTPVDGWWSWGGPNSGCDDNEVPVAWAPLPENWSYPLTNGQ